MMRLWKAKVNNWGWDKPDYVFAASREECEKKARTFPAGGVVEYAGNFTDLHALTILNKLPLHAAWMSREGLIQRLSEIKAELTGVPGAVANISVTEYRKLRGGL